MYTHTHTQAHTYTQLHFYSCKKLPLGKQHSTLCRLLQSSGSMTKMFCHRVHALFSQSHLHLFAIPTSISSVGEFHGTMSARLDIWVVKLPLWVNFKWPTHVSIMDGTEEWDRGSMNAQEWSKSCCESPILGPLCRKGWERFRARILLFSYFIFILLFAEFAEMYHDCTKVLRCVAMPKHMGNSPLMPSRSTVLASSNNLWGSISYQPGFNWSICSWNTQWDSDTHTARLRHILNTTHTHTA